MIKWLKRLLMSPAQRIGELHLRPVYAPMAWAYGMGCDDWAVWTCQGGHQFLLSAYHDQQCARDPCKTCGKPGEVTGFKKIAKPPDQG